MGLKDRLRGALPTAVWARLRVLGYRWRLWTFRPFKARHVYGGLPLELWIADPMAKGWYDHDWPEPAEFALLRRRGLKEGARVFNLGAHQCVVALMLSRVVGPGGRVVALEASGHNAAAGLRNKGLNGAAHLTVLHAAAAERSGKEYFGVGFNAQADDGSHAWGRVEVPARSVDDLSREFGAPDVLYIKVEGYEGRVLRGARETLAFRPDCFVEVHAGDGLERFGGSVSEILSHFPAAAYDLFVEYSREAPRGYVPLENASVFHPEQPFRLIALRKA